MTLMETLESLAVSYNKGEITLHYAACIIEAKSIKQLLELALHFNINFVDTNPITDDRLYELEKEYEGWRKSITPHRGSHMSNTPNDDHTLYKLNVYKTK